jgi:hypothetical protein
MPELIKEVGIIGEHEMLIIFPQDWGVAHGDDALYLSRLSMKGQPLGQTDTDKQMVDIYRKLITNFIRWGGPPQQPWLQVRGPDPCGLLHHPGVAARPAVPVCLRLHGHLPGAEGAPQDVLRQDDLLAHADLQVAE